MLHEDQLVPYRYGSRLTECSENPLTPIGRAEPLVGANLMIELQRSKQNHELEMLKCRGVIDVKMLEQQALAQKTIEAVSSVKNWLANRGDDDNFKVEAVTEEAGFFGPKLKSRVTVKARSW